MTQTIAHNLFEKGVAKAKAGDKVSAHKILLDAVEELYQSESCWLWLAITAPSPNTQLGFLQQALAINPSNQRTQAALKKLELQIEAPIETPKVENSVESLCPFCNAAISENEERCPTCLAFLSLKSIDSLLENKQVDHQILKGAIQRFRQEQKKKYSPDVSFYLSLAHLNLNQLSLGIAQLKELLPNRVDDESLVVQYQELKKREIKQESKLPSRKLVRDKPIAQKLGGVKPASQKPNVVNRIVRREASKKEVQAVVMVVDDSPTIRKLVSVVLKRQKYVVWEVKDGMEALAMLNDQIPDLILLDITMPRIDGYQVCKLIKNSAATKNIKIIMLSGKDGFFDKVRGRMAGADKYITKPFEPETLIKAVKEFV